MAAHAAARAVEDQAAQYVARAAGHAVATAHMADHAPGAAMYAIRALQADTSPALVAASIRREHEWQLQQLPEGLRDLVVSTFERKFRFLGL